MLRLMGSLLLLALVAATAQAEAAECPDDMPCIVIR